VLALATSAWGRDADAVTPVLDLSHESEGVRAGFFTPAGDRVARLLIDRVGLEYRTQGFFRVAWRPLVVLEGVTLEVSNPAAAWPEQGAQILRTMRTLGGRNELVMRRVEICVAGEPKISAASGVIRADGGLELTMPAGVNDAKSTPVAVRYFWLTGPEAGTLTRTAPPRQAKSLSSSSSTTVHPSQ
jgi:hypothetical protein